MRERSLRGGNGHVKDLECKSAQFFMIRQYVVGKSPNIQLVYKNWTYMKTRFSIKCTQSSVLTGTSDASKTQQKVKNK